MHPVATKALKSSRPAGNPPSEGPSLVRPPAAAHARALTSVLRGQPPAREGTPQSEALGLGRRPRARAIPMGCRRTGFQMRACTWCAPSQTGCGAGRGFIKVTVTHAGTGGCARVATSLDCLTSKPVRRCRRASGREQSSAQNSRPNLGATVAT